MSDGCANVKGERLSSSWGFSRILYQKALEIAQLSLEVNHPNAMFRLCDRGLGENPSKLVQSAKELNKQEEYDQVLCVFDRDPWTI
ncbi:MAG: hypothetical protein V7K21_17520 [Nostoc sp.]|uniref:hypothetical protein n=1 Tax=Nostoc sp. TaxID=1180 RepID=UPI002FF59882